MIVTINVSIMMKIKLNNFNTFEEKGDLKTKNEFMSYNKQLFPILLGMMKMGVEIEVSFPSRRVNYQRVMIGAKGISRFPFDLSKESRAGLLEYLLTGRHETFEKSRGEVTTAYSQPIDFQKIALRFFVRHKYRPLLSPRYREYPYYQWANIGFLKGNVIFKIIRTKELVKYLTEHYPNSYL